jgi:hypothetical protein
MAKKAAEDRAWCSAYGVCEEDEILIINFGISEFSILETISEFQNF